MSINLTEKLVTKLRETIDDFDRAVLEPFIKAIEKQNVYFQREEWHTTDPGAETEFAGTGEALLRFTDNDLKIETLNQYLRDPQTRYLFDLFIIRMVVAQALENKKSVSINISALNICDDGKKLLSFHSVLQDEFPQGFDPKKISFELLEHDAINDPPIVALRHKAVLAIYKMQEWGYNIGIDDLSFGRTDSIRAYNDLKRLKDLGPHVDFIKIDGKTIEDFAAQRISDAEFAAFLRSIQHNAPQAKIIFEWVKSPEQAAHLAAAFPVAAVQGNRLDSEKFRVEYKAARDSGKGPYFTGPPNP